MKTTKLYFRITTFFLLLLLGIAIGAKSEGLDTLRFVIAIAALGAISLLHFKIIRKKFPRYQSTAAN